MPTDLLHIFLMKDHYFQLLLYGDHTTPGPPRNVFTSKCLRSLRLIWRQGYRVGSATEASLLTNLSYRHRITTSCLEYRPIHYVKFSAFHGDQLGYNSSQGANEEVKL